MTSRQLLVVILVLAISASSARALINVEGRGAWPADWPEVLEPLREASSTLKIGTGIQEDVYTIPIADRAMFEKVWPAILELRTPSSRLTLHRVRAEAEAGEGPKRRDTQAAIRIRGPAAGRYAVHRDVEQSRRTDYRQLVRVGKALAMGGPWPESIIGEDGELPEYVVSEDLEDGTLTWVAYNPDAVDTPKPLRTRMRARIDIELVVDGEIIDLNRTRLPADVVIVDARFVETDLDGGPR
ncbi:hypothetical protein Mal4_17370 [Maioricimonas rarisocia]|uniref:Uncharacterized protein n=1 Tax=Maioricimonas rarisocia TaxID=2528026 RepID=A0A517Z4Q5_9PLAN|nr:hypothetical protein [Maioricimonas rarisocia]QDU37425.1 hypothetical protein Mal4_17370 [Maioricimonas rarisocia]